MSDIRKEANKKLDAAAEATRKAAKAVVNATKDAAHAAGEKLQDGGKFLKNV